MRKVFIPQVPTRFDKATGARVPSIDLNPAAEFGEMVEMSSSGNIAEVSSAIRDMMPGDMILATGDIILVAAAIAKASQRFGAISVLRWDKKRRQYTIEEVEL